MAAGSKQKLRLATIFYWVLLLYIIAALVWWAFSLFQQNKEMYELKKATLISTSSTYKSDLKNIEAQRTRNVSKYIGEGSAFLLLILIGAGFIYRSVRRQFKLQQQQQNFVMAVTHELKTPLAVSRLNLETLQKYQLEEGKKQKLIQTTLQETLRLDTLINNILISSQLEANAYTIAKEELDFSALVTDVVRGFQNRYPYRKVLMEVEAEIELRGDTMLLKLLLSNLLENANKYSDKDTAIAVKLARQQAMVQLEVIDEGEGIPDNEKKAVFQKFYRVGNEQTRKSQGTGLGLYICKRLVAYHAGQISVKNNHPAGSKFIVQFYSA